MIFAFAMTAMNVLGHIGYELFPKNFLQQPLGKYLTLQRITICTIIITNVIMDYILIFGI